MDGKRTIKKLLDFKPGGMLKGKPRLRNMAVIKCDLKNMVVRRMKKEAVDRTRRESVVKKTKAELKELWF
jgi:hypothetical protein